MGQINVTLRDGAVETLNGVEGESLMRIIRNAGLTDILALCNGNCSCATCHIYVDAQFLGHLGAPSEDEECLVEALRHCMPNSRLSCQLVFSEALDGVRITIAPAE